MLFRIAEFAGLLRKNGVRASTAEILDAVAALQVLGLDEPTTVRAALAATLIKRFEDLEVFHELFGLFFFRPSEFLRTEQSPLVEELRNRGMSEEEIERLLALLGDQAARLDPTVRMALGLRKSDIEALLRLSGLRVDFGRLVNPLQIGFFTQQVLDQLRFADAQAQLGQLSAGLSGALGTTRAAEVAHLLQENLASLRVRVRGYVKDQFDQRNIRYAEEMRRDILVHKHFGQMSQQELLRLRHEVLRLAQKLRTQASLRPRQRRRGRLDMRRTLRHALQSGGLPFALKLRHRRVEKPRLCILCDISDSVRHVSRFMLQFVYALQEMFAKVRCFVFVSDLGEATDLFSRHEIDAAVDRALSGEVIPVYTNSNYGRALRKFVDRYLEAVTSRTTVILIGDGRSNYFPPEAWALGRVRARAKHVLWLNPEQPASWMFGDSAMRDYQPHVSRIEVVSNLDTLRRVIDQLVL